MHCHISTGLGLQIKHERGYIHTFSIYRQIAREKKERYQFNQSGIFFKEQWYYNCANYGALQKINPKGVLNWHFSNKILDLWVLIQNDLSLKTWGMCEKISLLYEFNFLPTEKYSTVFLFYIFNFSYHNLPTLTHKRHIQGKEGWVNSIF